MWLENSRDIAWVFRRLGYILLDLDLTSLCTEVRDVRVANMVNGKETGLVVFANSKEIELMRIKCKL
jgi:hypothetical protein